MNIKTGKMKIEKKSLQRWDRLRQYIEAGAYRLLLPREETDPQYKEEIIRQKELNDMMERMDARERTFYERKCRQRGGTSGILSTSSAGLLVTPKPMETITENKPSVVPIKDNNLDKHVVRLATDRREGCLSSSCRRLQPVVDTGEEYDYDRNEDVRLEDVKSTITPRTMRTKTADMYKVACSKCGVVASSNYLRQLSTRSMVDLKNTLMTAADVKAIAISLVKDKRVMSLDLSYNKIGPLGVMYIGEMLIRNKGLSELDLSGTQPGREGLEVLAEALQYNTTLKVLKLEDNSIEHTEVPLIVNMLKNVTLQELYLGNNCLGYDGGLLLASAIAKNTTLQTLDLKWNHIRRDSAIQLCKALGENKSLRSLDMSWNGLGKEGCIALARSLPKNTSLQKLNISSNRVDMTSLRFLLHGLVHNKCLKCVQMGKNPITTDGAKAILRAIQSSKVSQLQEIMLEDVPVDDEFVTLVDRLQEKEKIKITHGEILLSGLQIAEREHDPHDLNRFDPVLVLVEYMRIDNLRLIDFFQYLDSSNKDRLSRSDFRDGVANLSIPLTEHHLDIVMEKLDLKKDGVVDLEEFMTVQREVQRQITNRTTRARRKNKKDDEGLASLRKIIKEIIEKRNKTNKEKAVARRMSREANQQNGIDSGRRFSQVWAAAANAVTSVRRFSESAASGQNEQSKSLSFLQALKQVQRARESPTNRIIEEEVPVGN